MKTRTRLTKSENKPGVTVYTNNHNGAPVPYELWRINIIMKLNRYEKKIIKGIVESRKNIYETPKRDRLSYKPCKEYDAALSLFMKKLIYAEATNELEFEGPATPDPRFRWFTCKLHKPYATKRELRETTMKSY